MRKQHLLLSTALVWACFVAPGTATANEDFDIPSGVETRWISTENTTGAKGKGGMTNDGRKGAAWLVLEAGEKKIVADIQGPGVIRRIWATTYKRRPDLYRGLVKDPIYFQTDIRVTIQQMFGATIEQYLKHIKPENYPELVAGHQKFDPGKYTEKNARDWANFEGPADVCATAYWYQTLPSPDFGPIESYEKRMADLHLKPEVVPGSQTMPAPAAAPRLRGIRPRAD